MDSCSLRLVGASRAAAINARANASRSTGSPLSVTTIRQERAPFFLTLFARRATGLPGTVLTRPCAGWLATRGHRGGFEVCWCEPRRKLLGLRKNRVHIRRNDPPLLRSDARDEAKRCVVRRGLVFAVEVPVG